MNTKTKHTTVTQCHRQAKKLQTISCVQRNVVGEGEPIRLADQHKSLKTKHPYFTRVCIPSKVNVGKWDWLGKWTRKVQEETYSCHVQTHCRTEEPYSSFI